METCIEKAIEHFQAREYFTSDELLDFWRKRDYDLNLNTFYRRVNRLKNETNLAELLRNIYTFSEKPYFKPRKENILKRIVDIYNEKYPEIDYCIWQTAWLHEFMIHQPGRQFTIFETEKDVVEPVLFLLKSSEWQVFLNTDTTTIDYLFIEDKEFIVIKSMISRSPLLIQEKISIPSLEKILTDVFCDTKLFSPYSGLELSNIFKNAQKKYHINYSRLISYATRRNKKKEVLELLIQFADNSLKKLLNDIK